MNFLRVFLALLLLVPAPAFADYLGSYKIDDTCTFTAVTHDAATGALTDADSVPSYRVYEDETGTAILTGSMAKLDDANTTGHYSEQITLSAANGLEKGKSYNVVVTAAVDSITGGTTHRFQIEAEVDSNAVSNIGANVITASAVADDSIDAGAIAASAVGASEVATDAITSAEIADNAIDAGALATDTITAAKIASAAIAADEIATDAIGAAEVAADAIGASELASAAIAADEIATDAIGAAELAANSITSSEIADDAIDAGAVAASTLGASEIATDAIGAAEANIDLSVEIAGVLGHTTWYVDDAGNDSNDGRSQATAKLTVSAAITACSPGDKIVILPGTYTSPGNGFNVPSGKDGITIEGLDRDGVILACTFSGGAILDVDADNVTVRNLSCVSTGLDATGLVGIALDNCDGGLVENCFVNVDTTHSPLSDTTIVAVTLGASNNCEVAKCDLRASYDAISGSTGGGTYIHDNVCTAEYDCITLVNYKNARLVNNRFFTDASWSTSAIHHAGQFHNSSSTASTPSTTTNAIYSEGNTYITVTSANRTATTGAVTAQGHFFSIGDSFVVRSTHGSASGALQGIDDEHAASTYRPALITVVGGSISTSTASAQTVRPFNLGDSSSLAQVSQLTWTPGSSVGTVREGLVSTAPGRPLDVSTGGEAGLDWANVGSPTASQTLSGTTVGTATSVTAVATGGITAASLAADSITSSEVADGAIDAGALATDTITAAKIAADAITASEIGSAAIAADEIATDAIGAAELAADSIGASEVAADAVGASEVATGAIAADAFASGAIDAAAIAADAIGASELATDAVGAAEVAADAIDASAIATDAIGAAEVAANAITSAEIDLSSEAVASVTGNVGGNVAGSVATVTAVSAGGITASSFAADSITAAKLHSDVTTEIQNGLATAATLGSPAGASLAADIAAIEAQTDDIGVAGVGLTDIGVTLSPEDIEDIAAAVEIDEAAVADAVWDEATTSHTTSGTFGEQLKTDVDAILDDTGTSGVQLPAGEIDATAIATAAIDADAIAADALGASELAADAIGASEIAVDAIGASEIAANAITSAEADLSGEGVLSAGTVDVLGTNAISAASIASGAIGADEIATDALGAAEIAADALASSELATTAVAEIQSGLATTANFTTLDGKVDTIDGIVDSILVDTAEIGTAGAGLTALATQTSVNTIDDLLDTEIAALTSKLPSNSRKMAGEGLIATDLDDIEGGGGGGGVVLPISQVPVPAARLWVLKSTTRGLEGEARITMEVGELKTYGVDFRNDLAANGRLIDVETPVITSGTADGITFGTIAADTLGIDKTQAKVEIGAVTAGTYVIEFEVEYDDSDGGGIATGKVTLIVVE